MYTTEQIQAIIAAWMECARKHAYWRNMCEQKGTAPDYIDHEELCRGAVVQARKWHRSLLEQCGISPPSVWLNEAQLPEVQSC